MLATLAAAAWAAPMAIADSPLEPTAPAGLRCAGLVDPGPAPDTSGNWRLQWDYQWQVLSTDAIFNSYVPMAVSLDTSCDAYVAAWSPTGGRVVKLSPNGTTLSVWGSDGQAPGQLGRPEGIAVDVSGDVYVADSDNSRVQEFGPDGKVLRIWASSYGCRDLSVPCQTIPDNATFNGNISIAVDGTGAISVGDGYHGVKRFAPNGPLTGSWDTAVPNSDIQQVTVDRHGNVWAAYTSDLLVEWGPDGKVLSKIGTHGSGPGQLALPRGIAMDGDGNLYVAEEDNERVQKLDSSGNFLEAWGRCSDASASGGCSAFTNGNGPGEFFFPRGLAVDGRGELWLAERANYRVQVLKAIPSWVAAQPQTSASPSAQPTASPATPNINVPGATDCGSDLGCLESQAAACSPATITMDVGALLGAPGRLIETMSLQPDPAGSDACQFNIAVQQAEGTLSTMIGRSGTCLFATEDLAAMLEQWNEGSFSTDDWSTGSCQGSFFGS